MYDNQMTSANQQFIEGTPVYDAGGDKLGSVSEHNVQGGYLVVHKGLLFPKDVYVPLSAVDSNDANGVYLNVYKDDIQNQNWDSPPATNTTAMDRGTVDTTTTTATQADLTGTTTAPRADWTDTTGTEDVRVPVMEEELVVGKREEEIGRVHLHKDVVEEQQTITEPVTREEVVVERVPVQGNYTDVGPDVFTEKDIDVPVMGEELVTSKRAVVTEEVRLHKDAVTENEQISDTVRKERVVVDGADEVRGADSQIDSTRR